MSGGRTAQAGVSREGILRLRDTNRVVSIAVSLQLGDLGAHLRVGVDASSAVNLRRDNARLVPQGQAVFVDEAEMIVPLLDHAHHLARQVLRAFPAFGPMPSDHDWRVMQA